MTEPAAALAALRDDLLAAGLPPESFQLAGVHESTPLPTDFWFVRPGQAGWWEVGSYERGVWDVRVVCGSVAEAGAILRRIL